MFTYSFSGKLPIDLPPMPDTSNCDDIITQNDFYNFAPIILNHLGWHMKNSRRFFKFFIHDHPSFF
jgi:hypothetical protein